MCAWRSITTPRIEADSQSEAPGSRHAQDSIARNTLFALANRVVGAFFLAGLTLYLVRALGPDGYGVFAIALAVAGLLALPTDFGISASAGRFIADHRGDRAEVARVVSDALRLKLVLGGTVGAAVFASAGPIASFYDEPDLTWPLRAIALALFGHSIVLLLGNAFTAQGKVSANFTIDLSGSVVETATSVALVMAGAGVIGAAAGRAAGSLFAAAVAVAVTLRFLGRGSLSLGGRGAGTTRRIARYAGSLAVVDWAWSFFVHLDGLIIGALLTSEAVGIFRAPLRLLAVLGLPGLALSAGVAPRMALGAREGPNVEAFIRAIRYLIVFQAALVAPLLVWAGPIVDVVLGAGYEESATVLRAITPYIFLFGLAPLISVSANYLGEARWRPPIVIAALLVNVVFDVVFIPRIGVVAAAIGTDVAFAFYVPAHLWICRRVVDVPLAPMIRSLVRSLLAAAAMAGVLLLFGTTSLSLGEWLLGGFLGLLAFAAVLFATREVTLEEVRLVRAEVLERLPRKTEGVS